MKYYLVREYFVKRLENADLKEAVSFHLPCIKDLDKMKFSKNFPRNNWKKD